MRKEIQIMSNAKKIMEAERRVDLANEAIATLEREPSIHRVSEFGRSEMLMARKELLAAERALDVLRYQARSESNSFSGYRLAYVG